MAIGFDVSLGGVGWAFACLLPCWKGQSSRFQCILFRSQ